MRLEYEAVQDRTDEESWRVEAIDYDRDGLVYVALFLGPNAKERAHEYAEFKNDGASERDLHVDQVYAGLGT